MFLIILSLTYPHKIKLVNAPTPKLRRLHVMFDECLISVGIIYKTLFIQLLMKGYARNVSHINTLWYWNFSCVILYLSDSTLRISTLCTVLVIIYKKRPIHADGIQNSLARSSTELDKGWEVIQTTTYMSPNHRSKVYRSKVHVIGHKSITNLTEGKSVVWRLERKNPWDYLPSQTVHLNSLRAL